MAVFIGPKPNGGRGLPALIDSDDPALMDLDPAPIDLDPTLMDYDPALTDSVDPADRLGSGADSLGDRLGGETV